MVAPDLHKVVPAGVLRRLAAAIYDWLLALAVMIMISLLLVAPTGEAIDPGNWIYQLLLVAIVVSFFAGFWRYRGQTPGMRAWRLHLTHVNGGPVSPTQALRRLGAAIVAAIPFGLGFWWQWLDGDGLSWADRWSDTRLCYTPRSRNE